MTIDSLLQPFQHFGVHLGLERIIKLLANLGNPHHQVPVIHVAGTNGKGSVCAYLSSILTKAGYHTGRYTSPHLVDWTERICLNEQPISSEEFCQLLLQVQAAITQGEESPTQFEVITAAAWLYFAQAKVDVAVVEVGLGGRLDATNVCSKPLVTIITSISREHWQVLGSTLADIATEKAAILKPVCPAVIGPLPREAEQVVRSRALELQCPVITPQPSQSISPGWAEYQTQSSKFLKYPLPLQGQIQLTNSALAYR
ncbi:MAG: bifunctional folylpolyglutamate synthase/dihydrofolate synthase, partial [Microcystaceae cyanobacterium]